MFTDFWERERQGERERDSERETLIGCLHTHLPTRGWTRNLGMCPDQESNPQPFGVGDDIPTNWAKACYTNFYMSKCSCLAVHLVLW